MLETRLISDLIPYDRNPRDNAEAVDHVLESLRLHGQVKPIVLSAVGHPFEQEIICCGHTTMQALKKFGATEAKVVVKSFDSESEFVDYNIRDNKTSEFAKWNESELVNLCSEFEIDLAGMGFNPDELGSGESKEGLTDEDDVPEVPAEPVAKLGQMWKLGDHRLMCGDSTDREQVERLMGGEKADSICTDPPYGIGIDGQKESKSANPKHNRKFHENRGWDSERPPKEVFEIILNMNCKAVIWGGNYFSDLLPATRGWIYWSKGQDGLTMSDGELAWTTESKPLRCVTVNRNALKGSVHPTQKPLEVIEYSLDFIDSGSLVLDLFGGSGSTLIACEKTGRKCRMMELDQKYCDVIIERWQNFTGKKAELVK